MLTARLILALTLEQVQAVLCLQLPSKPMEKLSSEDLSLPTMEREETTSRGSIQTARLIPALTRGRVQIILSILPPFRKAMEKLSSVAISHPTMEQGGTVWRG